MKQNNKNFIYKNDGIGLVEAVLAVAFAVILVVALLSLTTLNVQNALNVTEKQKASKESSLVLEKLRQSKDQNFVNFFDTFKSCSEDSYCQFSDPSSSTLVILTRCAEVRGNTCFAVTTGPDESIPVRELKVSVVSFYEIGKITFTSATETIFTNWRTRQ